MINKEIDVNYNVNMEMKDHFKTPIYVVIEKENIDIIKLLKILMLILNIVNDMNAAEDSLMILE